MPNLRRRLLLVVTAMVVIFAMSLVLTLSIAEGRRSRRRKGTEESASQPSIVPSLPPSESIPATFIPLPGIPSHPPFVTISDTPSSQPTLEEPPFESVPTSPTTPTYGDSPTTLMTPSFYLRPMRPIGGDIPTLPTKSPTRPPTFPNLPTAQGEFPSQPFSPAKPAAPTQIASTNSSHPTVSEPLSSAFPSLVPTQTDDSLRPSSSSSSSVLKTETPSSAPSSPGAPFVSSWHPSSEIPFLTVAPKSTTPSATTTTETGAPNFMVTSSPFLAPSAAPALTESHNGSIPIPSSSDSILPTPSHLNTLAPQLFVSSVPNPTQLPCNNAVPMPRLSRSPHPTHPPSNDIVTTPLLTQSSTPANFPSTDFAPTLHPQNGVVPTLRPTHPPIPPSDDVLYTLPPTRPLIPTRPPSSDFTLTPSPASQHGPPDGGIITQPSLPPLEINLPYIRPTSQPWTHSATPRPTKTAVAEKNDEVPSNKGKKRNSDGKGELDRPREKKRTTQKPTTKETKGAAPQAPYRDTSKDLTDQELNKRKSGYLKHEFQELRDTNYTYFFLKGKKKSAFETDDKKHDTRKRGKTKQGNGKSKSMKAKKSSSQSTRPRSSGKSREGRMRRPGVRQGRLPNPGERPASQKRRRMGYSKDG